MLAQITPHVFSEQIAERIVLCPGDGPHIEKKLAAPHHVEGVRMVPGQPPDLFFGKQRGRQAVPEIRQPVDQADRPFPPGHEIVRQAFDKHPRSISAADAGKLEADIIPDPPRRQNYGRAHGEQRGGDDGVNPCPAAPKAPPQNDHRHHEVKKVYIGCPRERRTGERRTGQNYVTPRRGRARQDPGQHPGEQPDKEEGRNFRLDQPSVMGKTLGPQHNRQRQPGDTRIIDKLTRGQEDEKRRERRENRLSNEQRRQSA